MTLYKKGYVLIDGKHGIEEFKIETSVFGSALWTVSSMGTEEYGYSFSIECEGEPLPLSKDEDDWGYSPPNLEINYWSGSSDTAKPLISGDVLEIEKCVSEKYGHQTVIYRVSHEELDAVKIEIIATEENSVELKIEGETWDVSIAGDGEDEDTDENETKAKVRIHATMTFDDNQGPSFD